MRLRTFRRRHSRLKRSLPLDNSTRDISSTSGADPCTSQTHSDVDSSSDIAHSESATEDQTNDDESMADDATTVAATAPTTAAAGAASSSDKLNGSTESSKTSEKQNVCRMSTRKRKSRVDMDGQMISSPLSLAALDACIAASPDSYDSENTLSLALNKSITFRLQIRDAEVSTRDSSFQSNPTVDASPRKRVRKDSSAELEQTEVNGDTTSPRHSSSDNGSRANHRKSNGSFDKSADTNSPNEAMRRSSSNHQPSLPVDSEMTNGSQSTGIDDTVSKEPKNPSNEMSPQKSQESHRREAVALLSANGKSTNGEADSCDSANNKQIVEPSTPSKQFLISPKRIIDTVNLLKESPTDHYKMIFADENNMLLQLENLDLYDGRSTATLEKLEKMFRIKEEGERRQLQHHTRDQEFHRKMSHFESVTKGLSERFDNLKKVFAGERPPTFDQTLPPRPRISCNMKSVARNTWVSTVKW